MLLLLVYVGVALGFSFLCSIAEAVILSVTPPYVALLEEQGRRAGPVLRALKADVSRPLAAILTLNTVAHTVGAAGAGAQATYVFGDASVGVVSAVLTLLILVLSEIIPKSLGAHYWRQLAPVTAWFLRGLILVLYPFVVMSNALTRRLGTREGCQWPYHGGSANPEPASGCGSASPTRMARVSARASCSTASRTSSRTCCA